MLVWPANKRTTYSYVVSKAKGHVISDCIVLLGYRLCFIFSQQTVFKKNKKQLYFQMKIVIVMLLLIVNCYIKSAMSDIAKYLFSDQTAVGTL